MNVTINTKDLNEMIKGFREKAPELICKASILAHRKLAKQAAGRLKGGLAIFGGVRGSPDYKTSKNFEMPLAHTFNLYDSIGYRVIGSPGEQTSMVGANIDGESFADYAKYLDSGDIGGMEGIRPFLHFISDLYNANIWKNYFFQIFDKIKWKDFEISEEE